MYIQWLNWDKAMGAEFLSRLACLILDVYKAKRVVPTMAKKEVLQDHQRNGKTFLPPLQHMFGPMSEVSWVKTMLPELLWIALVQDYHGLRDGAALITALTRIARKCSASGQKSVFAAASAIGELAEDEKSCLKSELEASASLIEYQVALRPLTALYPECPLSFLCSGKPGSFVQEKGDIEYVKTLVREMYDRTSRDTTMVQATAIWLAFDSGVLKVTEGLALADFPEIEKYPQTVLSEKVAGSIRCALYMFFTEPHYPESPNWPKNFWNRGLELEKCYYEE